LEIEEVLTTKEIIALGISGAATSICTVVASTGSTVAVAICGFLIVIIIIAKQGN
jgi:hypothetical protein